MNTNKKSLSLFSGLALTAMFGAGLLSLALPKQAAANTAAFNIIHNTATVSYQDAGGHTQTPITATADVTVSLVQAAATLTAPDNQDINGGLPVTYNYTITATANGLDNYVLTSPTTESAGISGSGVVVNGGTGTVALGATTFVSIDGGRTVITVPNDNASDGIVNGLVADDLVVIGGVQYQIASVSDTGPAPGATSTITLTGALPAGDPAVGAVIGERKAFTVVVTPGTVSNATIDQTIAVVLTATAGAAVSTDSTTTTVKAVALDVKKYVRNVTTGTAGTTVHAINGANYYETGVTGAPGEILEYVIAITKPASSSEAKNIIISDPIPAFTHYVTTSMLVDATGDGWDVAPILDGDADTDAGETNGTTVYIYAGVSGSDGAAGYGNGTGGNLPAGLATTYGAFRVTVD